MVDIGLAAKKTMALHAPIKLLLKSPLLPRFHSVSFCLVSGQDLQVSGCDIRDSMLSTPNRLHKDTRQKNSNTACAFICLGKERGREGREWRGWWEREKRRVKGEKESARKKEKEIFIYGYGYLWTQEQREKNTNRKRRKRGEKRGSISFYSRRLSLVQAGIFILPGENANHQSQAACYVSV